jgi:hypothetical protein
MQLPDDPTLLQSVLSISPLEDPELTWAFAVFCGVLEPRAHDEFVAAVAECTPDTLADACLDFATRRAETLDTRSILAGRLWQYFLVGQSLMPEAPEAKTNPEVPATTGE